MIQTDADLSRRLRQLTGGRGGVRRRGDNDVSPQPRVALLRPARTRWSQPSAHEWQEARLPVVGRLWATWWLPAVLFAGCLVALVYLLQTSGVASVGYDIQHLQVERDDWQLRNEQLRLELAKRQSLTWIESEATGRLGMVRAEPTTLAYVKVGR